MSGENSFRLLLLQTLWWELSPLRSLASETQLHCHKSPSQAKTGKLLAVTHILPVAALYTGPESHCCTSIQICEKASLFFSCFTESKETKGKQIWHTKMSLCPISEGHLTTISHCQYFTCRTITHSKSVHIYLSLLRAMNCFNYRVIKPAVVHSKSGPTYHHTITVIGAQCENLSVSWTMFPFFLIIEEPEISLKVTATAENRDHIPGSSFKF